MECHRRPPPPMMISSRGPLLPPPQRGPYTMGGYATMPYLQSHPQNQGQPHPGKTMSEWNPGMLPPQNQHHYPPQQRPQHQHETQQCPPGPGPPQHQDQARPRHDQARPRHDQAPRPQQPRPPPLHHVRTMVIDLPMPPPSAPPPLLEKNVVDLRMPPPPLTTRPVRNMSDMGEITVASQYWVTELNQSLNCMRKSEILCDVHIQTTNGSRLRAHSSVLAAASPHLQSKFGELEQGMYTLRTSNIHAHIWECILEFMYVGVVNVKRSELEELRIAAEALDLDFLKKFCETSLASMNNKPTDDCDFELPFPLPEVPEVKDEPIESAATEYNQSAAQVEEEEEDTQSNAPADNVSTVSRRSTNSSRPAALNLPTAVENGCKEEDGSDVEMPLDLSSKCSTPPTSYGMSVYGGGGGGGGSVSSGVGTTFTSSHSTTQHQTLPLVISDFFPSGTESSGSGVGSSLGSSAAVAGAGATYEDSIVPAQDRHNTVSRQWEQQRYMHQYKLQARVQQQQQEQERHKQEKAKQYVTHRRLHEATSLQREIEQKQKAAAAAASAAYSRHHNHNNHPNPIVVAPQHNQPIMVKPTHPVQPFPRQVAVSASGGSTSSQHFKKRIVSSLCGSSSQRSEAGDSDISTNMQVQQQQQQQQPDKMNSLEQLAMVALSTSSHTNHNQSNIPSSVSSQREEKHEAEEVRALLRHQQPPVPSTTHTTMAVYQCTTTSNVVSTPSSSASLSPTKSLPGVGVRKTHGGPHLTTPPKSMFGRRAVSEFDANEDVEDEDRNSIAGGSDITGLNTSGGSGGQKRVKCPMCEKTYVGTSHLAVHLRTHTGERPFKCPVCQRGFRQKATLIGHMRTHSGEKPYMCTVCGKTFSQSGNKLIHERTHNDHRPWRCEICSKKFARKETLQIHQKVHTGEKPFRCQVCDKAFTQRANLRVHERIHKGEMRFECSTCSRRFLRKESKNQHERTHIGERPYMCPVCGKMFTQRGNRVSHIARHHPGVPLNDDSMSSSGDGSNDGDCMPVWLDSCSLEEGNNLALTQDDIDEMEDSTSSIMGNGGEHQLEEEYDDQEMGDAGDYDDDGSSSVSSNRLMIAE